jgi:hypothetical protein
MAMVFISHSSRQDEFAAKVRRRVQARLQDLRWVVRTDMDALKGGDEWRSVIYHWLAECDAAVVLLGRRALESSPWVRREVNILLWRRALGSPLTIVPALLGDVRSAEVQKAGFSELEPLQFVRMTSTADSDADAERLADQIAERFPTLAGAWQDDSPMARWIRIVTQYLKDVTDQQALIAAARQLQADDGWWPPSIPEGHRFLAHQLLGQALDGRTERALSEIAHFMATEALDRLIPLVAPTWVDGETARLLVPTPNAQRGIVAILNANLPDTARHYVQRAACCAMNFRIAEAPGVTGENVQDEFLRSCELGVRDLLGIPPQWRIEGKKLELVKPQPHDVPFLIVDPVGVPIERVVAVIRTLQARFQWLNIILLTGEIAPDEAHVASRELDGALILTPPLGEGDEFMASIVIHRLKDILKVVRGQLAGVA